MEENIEF